MKSGFRKPGFELLQEKKRGPRITWLLWTPAPSKMVKSNRKFFAGSATSLFSQENHFAITSRSKSEKRLLSKDNNESKVIKNETVLDPEQESQDE
ncbi:MAG TPA: hypothetical protein DCL49_07345 [Candidatus Omnitrophica bacterium]|nr:hypothetical protein [Candidatus Omnitrophota bacterium]